MENNIEHRKARIYYKGESIPVLVVSEDDRFYLLLLDWNDPELSNAETRQQESVRNLYMEALWGYEGAGEDLRSTNTRLEVCSLHKEESNVVLVFREPEPEQEEGEPTEMTDSDTAEQFPKMGKLTELDKQLNLMAHLNYEVKSWDISFPEDGEPQLYATFTKVEKVHPF